MSQPFHLAVEILGARGSTPSPGPGTLRYGGNTTCVSIRSQNGDRVIIDAGSGIRQLGRTLQAENPRATDINLFLTHFHWDHIQGLPFFSPLIQGGARVCFHAGVAPEETRARLERQMSDPFFTLDFNAAKAQCEFMQMNSAVVRCGAIAVEAFPLNHPQGAWGYRIESGGAAVVVATDVEHGHAKLDQVLRERATGADLLIYDAQYTDAEYAVRAGWGHSTSSAASRVARDAGVKQLVLSHHDPEHDDDTMDGIVAQAQALFAATTAAQEGSTLFI